MKKFKLHILFVGIVFGSFSLNTFAQVDYDIGSSKRKKTKEWMVVEVTQDPKKVTGLLDLGELKATAYGNKINATTTSIEARAKEMLQQEAYAKNANIVLIVEVKHYRAYGDLPSATMKATAYKK